MKINLPNLLTMFRILLTPLFIILLLNGEIDMALVIFILAGVSDGLDGFIARYFNQRTELGAHMDPLADKLLLISAFLCLAAVDLLPVWLTVIVLSRDLIIILGIGVCILNNKRVAIRPSLLSKLTTLCQLLVVTWVLLEAVTGETPGIRELLFWGTAALTTASGLHYMHIGLGILQNSRPPGSPSNKRDPGCFS